MCGCTADPSRRDGWQGGWPHAGLGFPRRRAARVRPDPPAGVYTLRILGDGGCGATRPRGAAASGERGCPGSSNRPRPGSSTPLPATRPRVPVLIGDESGHTDRRDAVVGRCGIAHRGHARRDRSTHRKHFQVVTGTSHSLNVVLSPLGATKTDSWLQSAERRAESGDRQVDRALRTARPAAGASIRRALHGTGPHRRSSEEPSETTVALVAYASAQLIEDAFQIGGGFAVVAGDPTVAQRLGDRDGGLHHTESPVLPRLRIRRAAHRGISPGNAASRSRGSRERSGCTALRRSLSWSSSSWPAFPQPTSSTSSPTCSVSGPTAPTGGVLPGRGLRPWWLRLRSPLFSAVVATALAVETRAFRLGRHAARCRRDAAGPWLLAPAALVVAAVLVGGFSLWWGVSPGIHWATFGAMLLETVLVPVLAACGRAWVKNHPADALGMQLDRARGRGSSVIRWPSSSSLPACGHRGASTFPLRSSASPTKWGRRVWMVLVFVAAGAPCSRRSSSSRGWAPVPSRAKPSIPT